MENRQVSEEGVGKRDANILWLTSWYPNESDPYSGDFIKRQAEAAAIYQTLKIVYVGKYAPNFYEGRSEIKMAGIAKDNLKENVLYYPDTGKSNNIFSKIRSLSRYFRKHKEFIGQLRENKEMPDLVHVHIAMKAGLIALYLNWKYKIPYVLTEHWSGYYQQSKDSLFKKSIFEQYLTKLILKKARLLLPVSQALGIQIDKYWMKVPFRKISNVVDTRLFYTAGYKTPGSFRFIHVSSLLYPKNPEGIVSAFSEMLRQKLNVELVLVGPVNSSLNKFISQQDIAPGKIISTGEITYEQVGIEMRKADALVLFSDYENMPCVILEALCTGIPVIATRVGGIPEVVSEENGILINPGDKTELLQAMTRMTLDISLFDKNKISQQAADLFSYETIGKKIKVVYDSLLTKEC